MQGPGESSSGAPTAPALALAPIDAARATRLRALAARLSAAAAGGDNAAPVAIVAVTGRDSAWHAESQRLAEWLCGGGAAPRGAVVVAAPTFAVVLAPVLTRAPLPQQQQQQEGREQQQQHDEKQQQQQRPSGTVRASFDTSSSGSGNGGSDRQTIDSALAAAAAASVEGHEPKPAALAQLLAGHRVAMPLGLEVAGGALRPLEPRPTLARWPLVAALAGAPGGDALRGLFESLADVTPEVRALMARADARHVSHLLTSRTPALRRAWADASAAITRRPPVARGVELSEALVAAPLADAAQAARAAARGPPPWACAPLCMPPRVLFGVRTADARATSDARTMREHLEERKRPVTHASIEVADGASCLRLARTVFFTHGAPPQVPGAGAGAAAGAGGAAAAGGEAGEAGATSSSGGAGGVGNNGTASGGSGSVGGGDLFTDGPALLRWYSAIVDAAHAAMRCFAAAAGAGTDPVAAARAAALEQLAKSAAALGLDGADAEPGSLAERLEFGLWAWDPEAGVPAGDAPAPGDGRLKTARLALRGVRGGAAGGGGGDLGAVVYADTFIEAPPAGGGADECGVSGSSGSGGGGVINLTESVGPGAATYACHGLEAAGTMLLVRLWQRALQVHAAGGSGTAAPQPPALPPPSPAAGGAAARSATAPGVSPADAAAPKGKKPRRKSAQPLRASAAAAAASAAAAAAASAEPQRRRSSDGSGPASGGGGGTGSAGNSATLPRVPPLPLPTAVGAAAAGGGVARSAFAAFLDCLGAPLLPSPDALAAGGGGVEVALCTGAAREPAVRGAAHFFARALVIVVRATRLFVFRIAPGAAGDVASVALCTYGAAPPAVVDSAADDDSTATAAAAAEPIGECLVLEGRKPACGAAPASLLTTNPYLVLPLRQLPPGARGALAAHVLPAWRRACDAAGVPFADGGGGGAAAATAPPPVPWALLAAVAGGTAADGAAAPSLARRLDSLSLRPA